MKKRTLKTHSGFRSSIKKETNTPTASAVKFYIDIKKKSKQKGEKLVIFGQFSSVPVIRRHCAVMGLGPKNPFVRGGFGSGLGY